MPISFPEGRTMTLYKGDIAKDVREHVRFKKRKKDRQRYLFPEFNYNMMSKKRANALVTSLFGIIARTLENGETVKLVGFGKFQVRFKWARKGRNPQTGEAIILKSRRVVTFQCSPKLREKINHD